MFDELETGERVSYLEDCLPQKPYNQVVSQYEEYSEDTVADLLSEGKRVLVSQMQQGRDYWEYLLENKGSLAEDFIQENSYRELAYYLSAMGDSGLETFPYRFFFDENTGLNEILSNEEASESEIQEYLISNGDNSVKKAFSEVGADIWNELGQEPTPRLAFIEDSGHLYIEYWLRTDTKQRFHERRGEFLEFPVLRKVICRIHFDDDFIELRGRNERKKDKEAALIATKNFLNDSIRFADDSELATDGGQDVEITDDSIRYFYTLSEFQSLSHANKDGTARSSWTAEDVRNDGRFPDDRPNNYNNLVFELDTLGRLSFQLNAEENSYRVFKHKILPQNHRTVTEYIWENLNDAP